MMTVAITGNAAAGKSTVARIWAEAGIPVISADDLARDVVAAGSPGLAAVVEAFGAKFLREDGSLHRAALRDWVFRDEEDRKRLEAILHPRIRALRDLWMARMRQEGHPLVVAEIPLLFEIGSEGDYEAVVFVDAPEEERVRRLVEDRGLKRREAKRIVESQLPAEGKRGRADFVLDNLGTPVELRERSLALLDLLRAKARRGGGS
jgi:dephospho-CoA kinase